MKIKGLPGEYSFKALFRTGNGWELSNNYYFENPLPEDEEIRWPVEVYEDGSVYCPAPEELE